MKTFKTYNVSEEVNVNQSGFIFNGVITRVIRIEEDGSGYYEVTFGKYNSKTIIATCEIIEGRYSAVISFEKDGINKSIEACSIKEAMNYLYDVIEPNGWKFEGIELGTKYAA